jgi:hypothetical protein
MQSSRYVLGALSLLIGALLPSLGLAQQIGGGPVQRAPVFAETGLVHDRTGFVIGAAYDRATRSAELFGVTQSAVLIGGSFGLTDWLTVGAIIPYETSTVKLRDRSEIEVSGVGDASLQTRVRVFGAGDEGVTAAFLGTAIFPTADEDDFGPNSFRAALGGGLSYSADPVSFHAAADVELASEEDYEELFGYSAALAYRPSDRFVLSGEFVGTKPRGDGDEEEGDGPDASNYAGFGARVFLGSDRSFYLDGGALFGVTDQAFDDLWSVGVGFVR